MKMPPNPHTKKGEPIVTKPKWTVVIVPYANQIRLACTIMHGKELCADCKKLIKKLIEHSIV